MPLLIGRCGDDGLSAIDGLGGFFKLLALETALFGALCLGARDCLYIRIRGGLREPLGKKKVSRVAVGDLNNITEPAEFAYVTS